MAEARSRVFASGLYDGQVVVVTVRLCLFAQRLKDASLVSWTARQVTSLFPASTSALLILLQGGGTGIGRAIAEQLGELGAKIAICGRRLQPLEDTTKALESKGVKCLYRQCTLGAVGSHIHLCFSHCKALHLYR